MCQFYLQKCIQLFIDEVSDMIAKVFPTNVALQLNKLSTRIREQFVVVSELECGAHAALADGAIEDITKMREPWFAPRTMREPRFAARTKNIFTGSRREPFSKLC